MSKLMETKESPYRDRFVSESKRIRLFSENVRGDELVWHRDERDRTITVLEGRGWQFQRDNELPQEMRPGQVIEVRAGEWHRVIKGDRNLKVEIREALPHSERNILGSQDTSMLTEAVTARLGDTEITGQLLAPKHFIGGSSGNNIMQRSLERRAELNPGESFFFLHRETKAIDASTGKLVSLPPQWIDIVSPYFKDLLSGTDNPDYQLLSRSSNPNITLVFSPSTGREYYVSVKDIAHRLGGASRSSQKPVADKVLGYICEHALAMGSSQTNRRLTSLTEIEAELRTDIRISPEFDALNETDLKDVLRFAERSIDAVRNSGFSLYEAYVDGSQTAKYDVVGSSDGIEQDFNCHVKFNQGSGGSRFIGLQTGEGDLNNPSTDLYRKIHKELRDEWENRVSDPMPLSATRKSAAEIEKRETGLNPPTELQFPGFFDNLLDELEVAEYNAAVAADVEKALTPPGGILSFAYFQQTGSTLDAPIKVKIVQYEQIDSTVDVVRSRDAIPSRAYEVLIQGLQPFHIEIRSLRQGHPPQLKTGKDYRAFEKLLNPQIYQGSA